MTTNNWTGPNGTQSFGTQGSSDSNWSLGHVPTALEDAVINTGANATTIDAATVEDVSSISLGSKDVLDVTGTGGFTAQNGTGSNVNNGTIDIADDGDLQVDSSIDNGSTGSIKLSGTSPSSYAALTFGETVYLNGNGSIEMAIGGPDTSNLIEGPTTRGGMVVDQTETISGTGTIGGDLTFYNQATIETNNSTSSSGGILHIEGSFEGGFLNENLVEAINGGTLIFGVDGESSEIGNDEEIDVDADGAVTTSLEIAGNMEIVGGNTSTIFLGGTHPSDQQIVSDGNTASLTLNGQTLKGAGTVGDIHLTLNVNESIVEADESGETLTLNTGTNSINNATGTLEATNGGQLTIDSNVDNDNGAIEADAGKVVVNSDIFTDSVPGFVGIDTGGTVEVASGGDIFGDVDFGGTSATLQLDTAGSQVGSVDGLTSGDTIYLPFVTYSASTTLRWIPNSNGIGGALVLKQGATVAGSVNFDDGYSAANFSQSNNGGGTDLSFASNPALPSATTAVMMMELSSNGTYEVYDIGQNQILAAYQLTQTTTQWQIAGLGDFSSSDTADMMMRNSSTGAFVVYDFRNNNITGATSMGQVGAPWQVAGFADFSGNTHETDMLMRNGSTGAFELYDIKNNNYTGFFSLGQVGPEWQVAGFADFSGNAGETDMLMRNGTTGAFELYDIANNNYTGFFSLGQVGPEWQVSGFGDFSGNAGETDMLMRDTSTGAFELYDISNNNYTGFFSLGQVGLEWQVAGFGDFSGNAGETDMLMRDTSTGAFELYDIANNQFSGFHSMGQVGPAWTVAAIGNDPPAASGASGAEMVQAIASLGSSGAGNATPAVAPSTFDPSQQSLLTTPQHG